MITFRPVFKHVLVEPVDASVSKSSKKSTVMIPEEVSKKAQKYTLCKVLEFSKDCIIPKAIVEGSRDRFILVESHMVEEIVIGEQTFYIVPENAAKLISSTEGGF